MAGRSDDYEVELAGTYSRKPWYHIGSCNTLWFVVVLLLVLPLVTLILVAKQDTSCPDFPAAASVGSATPDQIQACLNSNYLFVPYKTQETTAMGGPLVIQNATIWSGIAGDAIVNNADIYIANGKIQNVTASGVRFPVPPGARVINAMGRDLTPGIVDQHSHMGVYSWPDVDASQDGNEMTNPTTPFVRAVDAINPADLAIPHALGGGVTTAQILPGSGNLMGGEGTVIKLRVQPGVVPTVQDLLLMNAPRTLKMACGENPKRVYGSKGQMPMSRLGNGWLMRQMFDKASNLLSQQTDWCSQVPNPSTAFPRDLSLDGLIALLRGKAILQNHCYTVCDMESMIRISHEFGFQINTFHHALEAYKLADKLFVENISVALFIDHWGFKLEAYDASTYGAWILDRAGVNVVFKSDHPVLDSRYLQYEAAKSLNYNFTGMNALASITSRPAKALGLDNRLGSIRPGLDGDVVIWDRDPVTIGATPWAVFVDGVQLVDNSANLPLTAHPRHDTTFSLVQESGIAEKICPSTGQPIMVENYALVGVDVYTMTNLTTDPQRDQTIIVVDGIIQCMGTSIDCDASTASKVFTLTGGVVIPGIIEGGSHIGQEDIDQEPTTQDGQISGAGTDGSSLAVNAVDGIRIWAKHVRNPWIGGVQVAVSRPMGWQVVQGVSVAFQTCCGVTLDDNIITERLAVHIALGNDFKQDGLSASYSGQFAALRELFNEAMENINATDHPLQPLIDALPPNSKWPIVIEADSADVIDRIIQFIYAYKAQFIIFGAAEAHLLADKLAVITPAPHIMYRARPLPDTFERLRNWENATLVLQQAGLLVGLMADSTETARTLRWEAGYAREWGVDNNDAIAMITTNVAQMYGIPPPYGHILVGEEANFLLFNGDPLSPLTSLEVNVNGQYVECQVKQP